MDAAGHHGLHERAPVLLADGALAFVITRMVAAVADRLVLQIAFAALIADRAIQRVVDEQEFHDAAAAAANHFGIGMDNHTFRDRHAAGGDRFRRHFFYFHQAHAAIAGNRKPFVITEAGNFDAGRLGRLDHGGAVRNLDLDPVNGELCHRLFRRHC